MLALKTTMAAPSVNVYYTKPIMPDVSRVLACLYEKKIDFEPIDIYEGQHSVSGDLLKLRSRVSSAQPPPPPPPPPAGD